MIGDKKMYELTYILTPVLSNDQTAEDIGKINQTIESAGGTIMEIDQWGSQRMAYPINKKRNGYYVNMYFEGPSSIVARLERSLTIDDHVLRYLTLSMDKKMIQHYEARKARAAVAAAETSEEEASTE